MTTPSPLLSRAIRYATEAGVQRRALKVALVVGSVLNLINQGDLLLSQASDISWMKIGMTFIVPYLVSTYGVVTYRFAQEKPDASPG